MNVKNKMTYYNEEELEIIINEIIKIDVQFTLDDKYLKDKNNNYNLLKEFVLNVPTENENVVVLFKLKVATFNENHTLSNNESIYNHITKRKHDIFDLNKVIENDFGKLIYITDYKGNFHLNKTISIFKDFEHIFVGMGGSGDMFYISEKHRLSYVGSDDEFCGQLNQFEVRGKISDILDMLTLLTMGG